MLKRTVISFVTLMKNNISFLPNSLVIILLVLILLGTGMLDSVSKCFAQYPWIQKEANMPTGRWELSTCVVDGKIYAIGGAGPVYQALGTVEVYEIPGIPPKPRCPPQDRGYPPAW